MGRASAKGPVSPPATQEQRGRGGSVNLVPLRGAAGAGMLRSGRAAGCFAAGERGLFATSERAGQEAKPDPEEKGSASARSRCKAPRWEHPALRCGTGTTHPPRCRKEPAFTQRSPYFPNAANPAHGTPRLPQPRKMQGTGRLPLSLGGGMPLAETPLLVLFLKEREQEQSGNRTVWGQ